MRKTGKVEESVREKQENDVISILMITRDTYPTYDTMLETVFTVILPERGYDMTWLMLSSEVSQRTATQWNKSTVYLFPAPVNSTGISAYARETLCWVKLLAFATSLLYRKRFDIIQTRSKTSAQLFAWMASRLTRVKHVTQHDYPHPEQAVMESREGRRTMPRLNILHARVQLMLRDWIFRHSDLVLAISDEMRRQLIASGVSAQRVITFPMGTDCPPDPDPADITRLRTKLKLDGFPVVVYFGVIHPSRQLDFVIRVASRVNLDHPQTRWLFVGYGSDSERLKLEHTAKVTGLSDRIIFTGPVPRSDVPAYFSLADLSVSPIPITPIYWLSSPSKNIDALANGCPVVATNIPDQESVISESEGGIIAAFEESAFASAISTILANDDLGVAMGQRGKAYVRQNRSYEFLTGQLDRRYRKLLAGP
jgi:glycosyltransferase involved in cell wall biosynthesis